MRILFIFAAFFAVVAANSMQTAKPGFLPPSYPMWINGFEHAKAALPSDLSKYVPVNVTVFFEAKCPDSRDFIEKQAYPAVFGNVLPAGLFTLEFVPYGNAHTSYDSNKTAYNFTCQHGPDECLGNILETCFDYVVRNSSISLAYINCVFEGYFGGQPVWQATQECAVPLQMSNLNLYNAWVACNGTMGEALHAHNGDRTQTLDPPHTFIPWITFDSNGSSAIDDEARMNFAEVVVKYWFAKNT